MGDKNENEKSEPCEGIRQSRETDKEIKEMLKLMSKVCTNNEVNANSLAHLAESFKELATANSLTHYKLFSRTENLKVNFKGLETKHDEHVKHGSSEATNKHNRYTLLVSILAIGLSIATVVALLIQAGVL